MRGNCPRRCILRPSRCGRLSKAAVSPLIFELNRAVAAQAPHSL